MISFGEPMFLLTRKNLEQKFLQKIWIFDVISRDKNEKNMKTALNNSDFGQTLSSDREFFSDSNDTKIILSSALYGTKSTKNMVNYVIIDDVITWKSTGREKILYQMRN